MGWEALAAAGALGSWLAWQYHRDARASRQWRAGLLRPCETIGGLDGRMQTDGSGFPRIAGRFRGIPVDIALVHDDAGYRKLPVLWLVVTFATPLPDAPVLSALRRVQGTEFWSASDRLPHRCPTPLGWPGDVILRSTAETSLRASWAQAGARFFADPDAKELAVSSRGLRLVRCVAQARRAEYLVLRKSRFDLERVEGSVVAGLLEFGASLLVPWGGCGVC